MNAIGKALWCIESHFADPLTLENVAGASGLSRFHLSRTFAEVTGHSVIGYLRARRLTEAARSLAQGAPDILTVALDAGYASHEAFTRAFRDRFEVTPETVRDRRSLGTLPIVEAIRMSDIATANLPAPIFAEPGQLLIAGVKEYRTFEERSGIPAQWQRFQPHIGHVPEQIGMGTYGVCSTAGNPDTGFDYTCGVAVRSLDTLPEELSGIRIPEHRYAVFKHEDHVATIGSTCAAIFGEWLPQSGERVAEGPLMMIEHYSERFNPRTGVGGIEVWLPLAE